MLAEAVEEIAQGVFSPDDPGRFARLTSALRYHDYYMVTADFASYYETQRRLDALWRQPASWARSCVLNIAGMGWFSSDRAIGEYARTIWHASAGRNEAAPHPSLAELDASSAARPTSESR
jgi:starch phosphorylase